MHQSWKETALHRTAGNTSVQGLREALLAAAMEDNGETAVSAAEPLPVPGQQPNRDGGSYGNRG